MSPNANYRHRAAFHKCEETFQCWNTTLSNNCDSRSFPELHYIGKQSFVFCLVPLPLTHCYELTEMGAKDKMGDLTFCEMLVELDRTLLKLAPLCFESVKKKTEENNTNNTSRRRSRDTKIRYWLLKSHNRFSLTALNIIN